MPSTSDWGYGEENGPREFWPQSFPIAGNGRRQSPVDIDVERCFSPGSDSNSPSDDSSGQLPPINIDYEEATPTRFFNAGHTFQLDYDGGRRDGNKLSGGPLKTTYALLQAHCHWGDRDDFGSEHTVNGKAYPAELHFVHYAKEKYGTFQEALKHEDGLAVIGVFLKLGDEPNKAIEALDFDAISTVDSVGIYLDGAITNPRNFMPADMERFWTYNGSLTTPPCLESVKWIVMAEPITVSAEQLARFRNVCDHTGNPIKCNCRPTMPLNDRTVQASF